MSRTHVGENVTTRKVTVKTPSSSSIAIPEMDIIPDLHADPKRLGRSLQSARPRAKLGFLGDFIDTGKSADTRDDAAVLHKVRDRFALPAADHVWVTCPLAMQLKSCHSSFLSVALASTAMYHS